MVEATRFVIATGAHECAVTSGTTKQRGLAIATKTSKATQPRKGRWTCENLLWRIVNGRVV